MPMWVLHVMFVAHLCCQRFYLEVLSTRQWCTVWLVLDFVTSVIRKHLPTNEHLYDVITKSNDHLSSFGLIMYTDRTFRWVWTSFTETRQQVCVHQMWKAAVCCYIPTHTVLEQILCRGARKVLETNWQCMKSRQLTQQNKSSWITKYFGSMLELQMHSINHP